MVIAVSFNKRLPPAAAAAGRGTLAELMAKSKAAAEAKSTSMQMETPTIMQGFGKMANVMANAWGERRAEKDLDIQQQRQRELMGQIDPLTGGTQAQIAAMGEFDQELMMKMWADRSAKLRDDATRENWQPLTDPAERARMGIPADDTTPYKINITTGDFEPVSKGGTGDTINVGDKTQLEWDKLNDKQLTDIIGANIAEGQASRVKQGQIDLLEKQLPGMLNAGEGAVAKYLKENWNITLPGEKANKTQLFASIIDNMVPKERVAGSGTVSNFDAQRLLSSYPDIVNQPEANAMVIGYIRGIAQYNEQVGIISQQASMMPRDAGRKFYFDAVNKLENPLTKYEQDFARMRADLEKAGKVASQEDPNAPAATDATTDDPTAIRPEPPPGIQDWPTPEEWESWTPEERQPYIDYLKNPPRTVR